MGRFAYKGNNPIDDAKSLTILAMVAIGGILLAGPKLIKRLISGKK